MTTASVSYATKNRNPAVFDGHGYVNDLGKSKYWGVSATSPSCTTHKWRTMYVSGNTYRQVQPEFLTSETVLTELQCAWVAAFFYENINHPLPVTIKAKDGVGEYRVGSDRCIHYYANPLTPTRDPKYVKAAQPKIEKSIETIKPSTPTIVEQARAMLEKDTKGNDKGLSGIEVELLHTILDYAEDTQFSERFKKMANAIFEA